MDRVPTKVNKEDDRLSVNPTGTNLNALPSESARSVQPEAAVVAASFHFSLREVTSMLIGVSLFLTMGLMVLMMPETLGWFAISSAVAGLGVAVWLSRDRGFQRLFGGAEPARPIEKREPVPMTRVLNEAWTPAALITLGILIGFVLSQVLVVQLNAQSLVRTTMLV